MTGEAHRALRARLRAAGIEDDAFEADALLRIVTGRGHLEQDPETPLTAAQSARLEALCARRCTHYPLQYLAGKWPFYGLELAVGEGVLIPRADTECVVEQALALLAPLRAPRVLDLCAGSGAIGLAIASQRPDAQVTLVERSPAALAYCRANAAPFAGVRVAAADIFGFEAALAPDALDCITANPPYVTEDEYAALAPELAFEPREALVAAEDGLALYAYIAAHYLPALRPGGALVFEIGAAQRQAVTALLARAGYARIGARRDLGENDRCVFAKKPEKPAKTPLCP